MAHKKLDWIQTYSGIQMHPLNPHPDEISVEDIAHALSNTCRFTGHCNRFYSVAQHSVAVAAQVSNDAMLWGLLHDASEAYLCDIARPLKIQTEFRQYRKIEDNLMRVICDKFGLPHDMPEEVAVADRRWLVTEARDLGLLTPDWGPYVADIKPYPFRIRPASPEEAEKSFITWFDISFHR